MGIRHIAAALACAVAIGLAGCERSDKIPKLEKWKEYRGSVKGYNVEISETVRGGQCTRIVRLEAPDKLTVPYGVTGHDYFCDGNQDRVFRRDTYKHGYNSVVFSGGRGYFEPCPADRDEVAPFTEEQIIEAMSMIYQGMDEVYNEEHRISLEEFGF